MFVNSIGLGTLFHSVQSLELTYMVHSELQSSNFPQSSHGPWLEWVKLVHLR